VLSGRVAVKMADRTEFVMGQVISSAFPAATRGGWGEVGNVSLDLLGAGSTPGLLETPEPKKEGRLQTKFELAREGCPARRLELASATKRGCATVVARRPLLVAV
jgi:hypothetical protein